MTTNHTTPQNIIQTYSELKKMVEAGVKKINVTYKSGHKEQVRLFKSSEGGLCRFKKGSSTRGYKLIDRDIYEIVSFSEVKSLKSDASKWEEQLKNIKSKLIESGLWKDPVIEIDKALNIGYDKMCQVYDEYWEIPYNDERYNTLITQYPDFVAINEKGEKYFNCSFLWTWARIPKVEKMRFHHNLLHNNQTLEIIANHIKDKKDYRTSGDYRYDISFSYDAQNNKAFYSKEFRGCGNGYYYIALNATHAMFMEKD